jgi:polysaccharide deacetylase 2 family uncharacterized protein YibQ
MRLLFYTATAVFLILAGIFAFYAMQGTEQAGAARVVLSIDANERPSADAGRPQSSVDDVLAKAEARLAAAERAEEPVTPQNLSSEGAAQPEISQSGPSEANHETAGGTQHEASGEAATESVATAEPDASLASPEQEASDSPGIETLPGTTLAGLEDLQQSGLANAEPSTDDAASQSEAPAPEGREATADPSRAEVAAQTGGGEQQVAALRGSTSAEELRQAESGAQQEALSAPRVEPASPPQGISPRIATSTEQGAAAQPGPSGKTPAEQRQLKANFDAFMATLDDRRESETQPSVVGSPPFPPRRPEKAAEGGSGSWAGRQVAAKEDKPRKQDGRKREARVAILLRGVGRDDRNSNEAVTKLPPAISLGFMPFIGVSQQWARKAREFGHEIIVQLPLEPSDYPINNPGPETLLSSLSGDDNLSRMKTILGRFDNYTGVSNYLGGKMLQSEAALRPIVQGLKSKGLIYVGEGNNSHVLLRRLAGEVGLRYGAADMMIDAHPAPEEIRKALDRLAELARKDGSAIGMGYASRSTIEQLQAWSQTLAAEGITLVPVGALAQAPGAS